MVAIVGAPTLNNSEIPYIENVEGVAIVGEISPIIIHGLNFKPDTSIICSAGEISSIQKKPEKIEFNILSNSIGSWPIELKNDNLSSNDWNSYIPLLVARNGLNLTSEWLDFRVADGSSLGLVVSHVNQGLITKTFANSGYFLDSERGLCIGTTGNNYHSSGNYIQFNSFSFPFEATKCELIAFYDTTFINNIYPGRVRISIGKTNENTNKIIAGVEAYATVVNILHECSFPLPSLLQFVPSNSIASNSVYIFKIVFDFFKETINIFKLDDLLNFDSLGDFVIKDVPFFLLPEPERSTTAGIPLFNFFSPNSPSSIVAMRID